MSLDFRVSKIENYEENYHYEIETHDNNGNVVTRNEWHPVTQQIVWGCMSTGIGILAERNVAEWYTRYTIWCKIKGFPVGIPFKDVVQHIGLSTNVFPEETRLQWLKKVVGTSMDDIKRGIEYDRSHNNDTYNGVKKEKVK